MFRSRKDRDTQPPGQSPRGGLIPQQFQRLRPGSNEDQSGLCTGAGKGGRLGQEAVAGVNGLGPGLPGDFYYPVGAQVALPRRRRADAVGLVGVADVQGVPVRLGVDGDGL